VARKHGISTATFYQLRSKYGGMSVSDMQRLRELELENGRLKRMYADLSLDHAVLKEALTKNSDARATPRSGGMGDERQAA
jgi:putative transposase